MMVPSLHCTASAPSGRRVLIVDPDRASRELARRSLELPDLDVAEASGIGEALDLAARTPPDVLISELVLADGSGFALCRAVRESAEFASKPILIVSQWSREADRILGFECGIDDFLAKPYFARELLSRVRAVLRRSSQLERAPADRILTPRGGLSIDLHRRTVRVDGESVALTQREFSLLETLVASGGRVLSRSDLMKTAWNSPCGLHERSVDAHIKSLRHKLGSARDWIETVRGMGYRYADETRRLGLGRSAPPRPPVFHDPELSLLP
ncbi:response regulator transcription factor [Myxococcota bacterium]|nr:response regulator transcription factor [Myxococcota bacterium]